MQYKTFGPDAEVLGGGMLAFIESINYDNFSSILETHGVDNINPNEWYPQQVWLDVFSDIASQPGSSSNLVSIGMKIADTAPIPPEALTLPFQEVMLGFNDGSYFANNRGKDIGRIDVEILDEKHICMIDKTPYPDDFVYGAYYATARRLLPRGTDFTVKYDETIPRRGNGGDATRVHIIWK